MKPSIIFLSNTFMHHTAYFADCCVMNLPFNFFLKEKHCQALFPLSLSSPGPFFILTLGYPFTRNVILPSNLIFFSPPQHASSFNWILKENTALVRIVLIQVYMHTILTSFSQVDRNHFCVHEQGAGPSDPSKQTTNGGRIRKKVLSTLLHHLQR
jgi:hypothetical protein